MVTFHFLNSCVYHCCVFMKINGCILMICWNAKQSIQNRVRFQRGKNTAKVFHFLALVSFNVASNMQLHSHLIKAGS